MRRHVIASTLIVVAVGCKTTTTEPSAPTATAEPALSPADGSAATPAPSTATNSPTRVPGTPHDGEFAAIDVTWRGPTASVPVMKRPMSDELAGEVRLTQGQSVAWDASWVYVTQPTQMTATRDTVVAGVSDYDPQTGTSAAAIKSIAVTNGARLELLKIGAEGTCWIRFEGSPYYGGCPTSADFRPPAGSQPPHEWWIEVSGETATGWLRVDDRFLVNVGSDL